MLGCEPSQSFGRLCGLTRPREIIRRVPKSIRADNRFRVRIGGAIPGCCRCIPLLQGSMYPTKR